MKRTLLTCIALTLLAVPACKRQGPIAVIRNSNTYLNELDYNDMVQKQAVQHLRYWLAENCSCTNDEWIGDHADACEKTAKHILVVETRGPWHTAMQEYNGSFTEERPPQDPPEVPEPQTLCPGGE